MKYVKEKIIIALSRLDCYNADEMPKLEGAKRELEEALVYLSETKEKTLRDDFAEKAIIGFLVNGEHYAALSEGQTERAKAFARLAYLIADALIIVRKESK